MKVKLINVAEYDVKDDKVSQIPFDTFCHLCGDAEPSDVDETLPTARLFKSIGEFIDITQKDMSEIDTSENVRVLPNGQFVIFLKGK